jgi:acyl carrier protein
MTRDELSARIAQVIARVAKVSDPGTIASDKDLYRDIGVKSTAALDLLLSLEEEFEVAIPDQAFGDARTVGSLVSLIGDLT